MRIKIGHNSNYNPKETIQKNFNRRKPIVDRDPQIFNGVPLPSWIELSLIDACNRSCDFCPKVDENIAPNTYNKMEFSLIDKLCSDLKKINFKGAFCLCGYGEPLLHKDYLNIVNKLSEISPVEIITNGDVLNKETLKKIYESNASRLLISLYDGPEQLEKFTAMVKETDIPEDFVILRDRWYSDKIDFGVKLTNRTGTINIGNQPEININKKCYYTAYQVLIDWNGDFFLCPQDWQRRISMGNIMQKDFFDIWNGKLLSKYRKKLLNGDRSINPCNKCNAEGTVLGEKHYLAWKDINN